jgi:hypothetical protein
MNELLNENSKDITLQGWLFSKKKRNDSLNRHFSPWKERFFQLFSKRGILEIRTNDKKVSCIILRHATVIRHYYSSLASVTNAGSLSVFDDTLECTMQFSSIEGLIDWETGLQDSINYQQHLMRESKKAILQAFSSFIRSRLNNENIPINLPIASSVQSSDQSAISLASNSPNYAVKSESHVIARVTDHDDSKLIYEREEDDFTIIEHLPNDNDEWRVVKAPTSSLLPHNALFSNDLQSDCKINPPRMRIVIMVVGTR